MKRINQYIALVMMMLLIACSKENQPKEWISIYQSKFLEAYKIMDDNQIHIINEYLKGFKWQDKQIDTIGNSNLQFWLERENEEYRIRSYEIWFHEHDNSATIVEFREAKFAIIDRVELEQLLQLLKSGH